MKQKNEPSIVVPVCEMGGFGDIIAAYNLILSLKEKGLPLAVSFDDNMTHTKFTSLSSGSLEDIAAPKSFKQGPFLVIYPVGKREPVIPAEESIGSIHVQEYDHDPYYRSLYSEGKLVVATGLGFDPTINNPQAGIYLQQSLDSLLKEADESSETPGGILSLREKAVDDILDCGVQRKLGKKYLDHIVKGRWSLYYPSTLDSKYTFFRMLDEAKPHLQEPMTVFCMSSKDHEKMVIEAVCQKYGFSHVDCQGGRKRRTRGHITVVELGTIPQRHFHTLVSLADTLSLVTGDQSLSQMLQRGMSRNPIPFLYEFASWKNDLFRNLCRHIGASSEDAVTALKNYVCLQGDMGPDVRKAMGTKALAPGEMAALFYDDAAIKGFTQALPGIRDSFIQERQEAGVAGAEKLWSVTDTVSFIAQRVLGGMAMYEAVEPLLTSAGRDNAIR